MSMDGIQFMNKKLKDIVCVGLICGLTIGIGCVAWSRMQSVSKLEEEGEELAKEQARLEEILEESEAEYQALSNEIARAEEEVRLAQERLDLDHSLREYDNEMFYGEWSIRVCDASDTILDGEKASQTLSLQKDMIMISGEIVMTQSVYFYNVRAYMDEWDEWDIFQEIDFLTDEVRELFQTGYYIELKLDETEEWNRGLGGMKRGMISNAVYYMLDEDTMFCFDRENKKIYKLIRR